MTDAQNDLPLDNARAISGLMGLALDADQDAESISSGKKFTTPLTEELAEKFPSLEILERIGSGGMGCVYKVRQKNLDRIVALKILPAELGRDPKFAERFGREARALARLRHPNIVALYEIGEVDGLHYLTMEYMDGMNLREFMAVEQAGGIDVVDVMSQICAAVQYAHDQGVVHRDIKPENVLFDCRGHVKIADFGLAKLEQLATQDITLTGSRQAMGTLHYMAPEQWENPATVDHRADVYALGVMLYELITGRLPLGHFDPPSVLADAAPRVDDIVMKAMQSNADSRYQTAREVADDLKNLDVVASPQPVRAVQDRGTFTRFLDVGGHMRNIARRVAVNSESPDEGSPWLTALWLIAICGFSTLAPWVAGRNAFTSSIPNIPIDVPNVMPFLLAIAVFGIRMVPKQLGVKGDLLSIVLSSAAIAHVVMIYASWSETHAMWGRVIGVSIFPGLVGFLFVLVLLDTIWSVFTRFCGSVAVGARAWGSWVSGLNERVLGMTKERAAQEKRENKEKWNAFYRRLRMAGIGPRKMWDAFGIEDEPQPVASGPSPEEPRPVPPVAAAFVSTPIPTDEENVKEANESAG